MTAPRPNILQLTQPALAALLKEAGMPSFRVKQVWDWVHSKGVMDPAEMTNLSKGDRQILTAQLDWQQPTVSVQQNATDGVIKWLFKLHDGQEIETVLIPEATRGTLCISSQVGCTLACRFCHTGTQALARNLTADEIVAQVWLARKATGDFDLPRDHKKSVTNIVFMGMGEPLYNYPNVATACHIFLDEAGLAFGSRKITISTSGITEHIHTIGEDLGVNLAISLHAPDDATRTRIMPHNKRYPLADLMAAVRGFRLKEHRRITWEYVLLDGVNDTPAHADALVELIKGIPSLVNLIPFNPWPGSPFDCTPLERRKQFAARIGRANVDVTLRRTRGEDILAACGQLRSESSGRNTISLEYPSVVAVYGSEQQKSKVQIVAGDEPAAD